MFIQEDAELTCNTYSFLSSWTVKLRHFNLSGIFGSGSRSFYIAYVSPPDVSTWRNIHAAVEPLNRKVAFSKLGKCTDCCFDMSAPNGIHPSLSIKWWDAVLGAVPAATTILDLQGLPALAVAAMNSVKQYTTASPIRTKT